MKQHIRTISNIVIHCTATPQDTTVKSILDYWKSKGWRHPGYHHLIEADGTVHNLLDHRFVANGVKGHNHNSIHISYIGGVNDKGRPKDNRTKEQKQALRNTIDEVMWKNYVPANVNILGHRDFKGVRKACPSFDVKKWYETS